MMPNAQVWSDCTVVDQDGLVRMTMVVAVTVAPGVARELARTIREASNSVPHDKTYVADGIAYLFSSTPDVPATLAHGLEVAASRAEVFFENQP